MAVTQQIARLEEQLIHQCKDEAATFEALLSFKLISKDDYLDLDWAPSGLEQLITASKQLPEVNLALFMALNGSTLVDPQHRQGLENSPMYSDVTMLYSHEVKMVANHFGFLDLRTFQHWLSKNKEEFQSILKGLPPESFVNYYEHHLKSLIEFYQAAAQRNFATVMWWD